MLGLPRSSQKPLVWVRICLAAVPWHGGKHVRLSLLELLCACVHAHVCAYVCAFVVTHPGYVVCREGEQMKPSFHIPSI